mgnify:CR=1 FL=1
MPDIFSIIKDLTQNKKSFKDLSEEDLKQVNPYMINRFLSMNKDLVELVNHVQVIPYENKESYYKIYLEFLPKKSLWLQYIKSKNKVANKDLLLHLANYFECSSKEVEEYIKYMSKDDIKEILKLSFEDKEITKLMK